MNSRQRRKQRRMFKHAVPLTANIAYLSEEQLQKISDMVDWCKYRYGENGFLFKWRNGATFSFNTESHSIEFKLRWA